MLARDGVVFEFGSIRIDPSKRTIVRGDSENVPLPPRAFDLLLLLMERRGELVPKEELLARIWPDIHVEESNLPVMVSLIRRAIGDDARKQQDIQTVSKYGYRFIGEVKEISVREPAPPSMDQVVAPAVTASQAVPPPVSSRYTTVLVMGVCVLAVISVFFLIGRVGANVRHDTVILQTGSARPSRGGSFLSGPAAKMWYRKGRFAWDLQTKAGILQSVEYYQKAIAADAAYAPAWAGLAVSYVVLPSYSQPHDDQDRADAIKAVSLDDQLADAHVALGMVLLIDDRNFLQAEREFRLAVQLDPASSFAQGELALCLVSLGRTDEAVAHARKARDLHPLSSKAATDLGIVLYYSHRFSEAETELEEVVKLNPYSYRTHINLGKTYLSLERFEDARQEFQQAAMLSNNDPISQGLTAEAEAMGGDIEGAKSILAALEQRARTTYVAPISIAFATVGLGRLNDTLAYLKRARDEKAIASLYLKVDPTWQTLHRNPAFGMLTSDITLGNSGIPSTHFASPANLSPAGAGEEEPDKLR